jgi:hypothetical protein
MAGPDVVRLETGLTPEDAAMAAAKLDELLLLQEAQGTEIVIPRWRWEQVEDEGQRRAWLRLIARALYGPASTLHRGYFRSTAGAEEMGGISCQARPTGLWQASGEAGVVLWDAVGSSMSSVPFWLCQYNPAVVRRGIAPVGAVLRNVAVR